MRAFISKSINHNPVLGSEFQQISNEYKTQKGLLKYAEKLSLTWKSPVIVEIHLNWNTRYGKPDHIYEIENTGYSASLNKLL
jgi:hypothetical protein